MCANCGCGYATYDDVQTGAGMNDYTTEATETSEAK
jgi:hypothetical protein